MPEWKEIEAGAKEKLLSYAKNGGRLLLIGPGPGRLFSESLGLAETENLFEEPVYFSFGGGVANTYSERLALSAPKDAKTIAYTYKNGDLRFPEQPLAFVKNYGKGKLGYIAPAIGKEYLGHCSHVYGALYAGAVDYLLPEQTLQINVEGCLHTCLMQKDDKLYLT